MISTVLTASDQALKIDTMLPKLLQVEQQMQPSTQPNEAALLAKPYKGFKKGRSNRGRGRSSNSNRYSNSSGSGSRSQHSRINGSYHSNGSKPDRTCFYCGKHGHWAEECRKKQYDMQQQGGNGQHRGAIALTATSLEPAAACNRQPVRFVLDTGASRHLTADSSILLNKRPMEEEVTITFGNGSTGKATATGEVILYACGTTFHLKDVLLLGGVYLHTITVH